MSLRRRRPAQWLTFESNKAAAETIAITITRAAGAPAAVWRVVDGGQIYEYAGDTLSHAVVTGPCKIEARIAPKWIATLDAHAQSILHIKNLRRCISMTRIEIYQNTSLVLDISEMPANIVYIDAGGCSSIYGSIDSLRCSPTILSFMNCSLISGSIDSLFSGSISINLWGCPFITGTNIAHMHDIHAIYLADQNATQSRVNAIVDEIYNSKNLFTDSSKILNINEGNAAPDAAHIAKIEELVADWGWAITYFRP